jgi:signal transduction histidine kinase
MKNIFIIFILSFLYYISGEISFNLISTKNIVNLGIFAPEGIALAFIIYFGKKVWPGIFIGQFVLAYNNSLCELSSFEIATINSIEALLGVIIFNKLKLNKDLKTPKDILGLILIVVLFLQPFSALLSNTALLFHNNIEVSNFTSSIFSWWFGNAMGQMLFTPFLLILFSEYKKIKLNKLIILMIGFSLYIYFLIIMLVIENQLLLLSLTIPIILYIVATNGILYGVFLNITVAMIASYSIYSAIGAFSLSSGLDNTINYNLFILAHIAIVLTVGTLIEERKRYEESLEDLIAIEVNKNKEQQLLMLQQSRFAQMGEMISMIAHQWRQPLNNLDLINQLLVSKYKKNRLDDDTIEYFKTNSQKQIQLMSSTIDDFRNFFKTENIKSEFSVNDVIKNILDMTKEIYTNSGIKISFNETTEYKTVGYSNALAQVIINIINNAKDALIDNKIEDKRIDIGVKEINDNIIISIKDNAGGIPADIIDNIFDPYFSTKKDKNGTGLGLYMAKMIITEQMNSKIYANNNDDGAVFEIHLCGDIKC